jgi:hypothetical protein
MLCNLSEEHGDDKISFFRTNLPLDHFPIDCRYCLCQCPGGGNELVIALEERIYQFGAFFLSVSLDQSRGVEVNSHLVLYGRGFSLLSDDSGERLTTS